MRLIPLIIFLSGFYGTDARCQPTAGSLDVPRAADTLPVLSLLARVDQLQQDTVKLKVLIELSRYYWHAGKGENLDTCLYLARAAEKLGSRLENLAGAAEGVFMQAKVLAERNEMPQARKLLPRVVGESRVRLLLVLAEQYINHKPVVISWLDNAIPYANDALELSDSIRSDRWRNECLLLMGKYYFERGDLEKGEKSILAIISFYHRSGDRSAEAHYWSELDLYMPKIDSTYPAHLRACRNAYEIYRQAGLQEDALFALRDWARMELEYEHLDTAERQFQTVLQLFSSLKKKPTAMTLLSMSELYLYKNDMGKMSFYAFQGLEGLKPSDQHLRMAFHNILSEGSGRLGQTDNLLREARISMDIAVANNFPNMFFVCRLIVNGLIKKDSTLEALGYLRHFTLSHPPQSTQQSCMIYYCYATIYDHLGEFNKAEQYFLHLIRSESEVRKEQRQSIFGSIYMTGAEASESVGKFYIRWGKNLEAIPYLQKAISDPPMMKQSEDRRMLELMLSQAYQAIGDYRSALLHHTRYSDLNDSIFNVEKVKQFQSLEVRYESRQREQALKLLQLQSQTDRAQLRETSLQRNITLVGAILLFLLILLSYHAYRIKQRNLRQMKSQQLMIEHQNQMQQQLLGEKDKLLVEKDLLIKENHHRVKNNLNIIVSLLESQSEYLKNPAARAALGDTQNRVHAVFLLHEKLSRLTAGTEVNAARYVTELIDHLNEMFDTANNSIVITQRIDPMAIDAGDMLPLGLIINEAVTNAIKHAFPPGRQGAIHLRLNQEASGLIRLQVRDNGVGLPIELRPDEDHSLGFSLINGLVAQLRGSWTIENDGGVAVTVQFSRHRSIDYSEAEKSPATISY